MIEADDRISAGFGKIIEEWYMRDESRKGKQSDSSKTSNI